MKKKIVLVIILIIAIGVFLLFGMRKKGAKYSDTQKYNSGSYSTTLFDTSYVHKVNIEIAQSDWEDLLKNPTEKTKYKANAIIDGNRIENISFATKGNTSLTEVALSDSNRYSFKLNFGKYVDNQTFFGLDKLNLNNTMSDTTYMKDYISYYIMRKMDVEAPLCGYVQLFINGQEHGLYIAIEEVEDSFLERNGNSIKSAMYKPEGDDDNKGGVGPEMNFQNMPNKPPMNGENNIERPDKTSPVKETKGTDLVYKDDNFDSYSFIFDNNVTKVTEEDKENLIQALKALSTLENVEEYWNISDVINYFVAHNYVLNFDSYTGMMLHNYYLLQDKGKTSIIPWDYNLAFGGLSDMKLKKQQSDNEEKNDSTSLINYPIDSPLSGATEEERPLWKMIVSNENYLEEYHNRMEELITKTNEITGEIDKVYALIREYVKSDPNAFYKVNEFDDGVKTLKEFCNLRSESIKGQLEGTIGATMQSQNENSSSLVDASNINIESMGMQGGDKDNRNRDMFQKRPNF